MSTKFWQFVLVIEVNCSFYWHFEMWAVVIVKNAKRIWGTSKKLLPYTQPKPAGAGIDLSSIIIFIWSSKKS